MHFQSPFLCRIFAALFPASYIGISLFEGNIQRPTLRRGGRRAEMLQLCKNRQRSDTLFKSVMSLTFF
jgi:hypothetical protein